MRRATRPRAGRPKTTDASRARRARSKEDPREAKARDRGQYAVADVFRPGPAR